MSLLDIYLPSFVQKTPSLINPSKTPKIPPSNPSKTPKTPEQEYKKELRAMDDEAELLAERASLNWIRLAETKSDPEKTETYRWKMNAIREELQRRESLKREILPHERLDFGEPPDNKPEIIREKTSTRLGQVIPKNPWEI